MAKVDTTLVGPLSNELVSAAAEPRRTVRRRSRRRTRGWLYRIEPLLVVGAVLAAGEVAPRLDLVPRRFFPPVSEVFTELARMVLTSEYWSLLWATISGWGIGLALALAVGVTIGMLAGLFEPVYRSLRFVIELLRPVPSVSLIPLVVIWIGSGVEAKVFLIFFASLWPILIHAIYGVRDVDPVAWDTAKLYGLGPLARMRRITLPSATPYLATGVRLSAATALILCVTAELVVGSRGIGEQIYAAQSVADYDRMYALVVTAGLLGLAINSTFEALERRVLRWHPSQRGND